MVINFKIIFIGIIAAFITLVIFTQYQTEIPIEESNIHDIEFFNFNIDFKDFDMVELPIDSIFIIKAIKDDYILDKNIHKYLKLAFELDDENLSLYDELSNTDEKTVVIFPIFTSSAYNSPGFYDYYSDRCDVSCLTVPIKLILRTEMGGNGAQILKLLNYKFLSDIDVDKNPEILNHFDKVILLHSEYVTKKEFDAITSHPNVIYLYPNALYAEIEVNYDQNTATLIRGHGYPEKHIDNGFDWVFDNTRPYEFDRDCDNWEFYEIENGKMLNCFPEEQLYEDASLLKALKEI
ncbi:hypothetical protein NZNM25_18410 [Nitrosopumilus zosterae]|uniref:Uncharacterized protein n=1 Tax=Nitrosopumilus zosterae TaxID=718286 RepID=A0A2S2KTQ3_9ARCH|nr:hypothetical protein [Nitrosopumilus zosterae]BDQ31905.1 hypothetical protein NZOSNM25_002047 [Nitrosopumilus zosterae]GBH35050.1 hypothetical protein NZNM25_18410 [Nitrosopumilus zosterae]